MSAFFDIDTQIDFLYPSGSLYVEGAEALIPAIARLNRYAMDNRIPLVSTVCAHAEDDPEFQIWPPHCIVGTVGQTKPAALLVGQRIIEKNSTDPFQCEEFQKYVEATESAECVIYGVVAEICVRKCALGLAERNCSVTVIDDAVCGVDEEAVAAFRNQLEARGGRFAHSSAIIG